MYSVGELIVYGGTGVCEVEAVETKGERQFYRLRPLYQSGIISVPVDGKVFMRPVISREEAEELAADEVARPGTSEHQTGICADILNGDYAGRPTMTQDFKWTPEAQWMKENCDTFGFILRFLEEKEDVTGIKFEPWHFRYVGKEIASYIMANGMTLEEFTEEAQEAVAEFESRGGDVEEQLAYEYSRLNAPPESYVLDELGEDGDAEVSLVF